jgi:hypothetical protein
MSAAAALIFGIIMLVYGLILNISLRQPAKDLYSIDWSTLHGSQHVVVDLDFLMDPYMLYEKDGVVTSQFYTIPDLYQADDGRLYMGGFMGVAVTKENFAQYDKLVDQSWEWWNDETGTVAFTSEPIHIDGYIRKMSANDKKYMREYLQDMGYTSSEIDQLIVPYVLMNNASSNVGFIFGGLLLLVLGGVLGAFAVMRTIKDKKAQETSFSVGSMGGNYGGTYSGNDGYGVVKDPFAGNNGNNFQ